MSRQVVQMSPVGKVTFSGNKRSKSIKISVKPDKSVLVSYPLFVKSDEVLRFLQKNEKWILEQQKKFDNKKNSIDWNKELKTKLHTVFFEKGDKNIAKINGGTAKITVIDFNSDESKKFIEKVVDEVYRFEAKKLLPPKLAELALQNGFQYNKVTVRNNKRNWGSCSSQNNISLNLQMMKLPDCLIEYILLHELVHTQIKNHGPLFWSKLDQITNNRARELAKEVKKYSTYDF